MLISASTAAILIATAVTLLSIPALGELSIDTEGINLENLTWSKKAHKIIGSFQVENNTTFDIKYFYVQCHLSDQAGAAFPPRVADVNEAIPAGRTRAFRDFVLAVDLPPDVAAVTCAIAMIDR